MKKQIRFFTIGLYCFSFCFPVLVCRSQAAQSKTDSLLVGTWTGSSICQIKNSPCHDEIVVYHIKKIGTKDSFNIQANKMVNGQEEEMGPVDCKLNRKTNQLVSTSYNGIWTFYLKDGKLEGTLVYRGDLYRKISVTKK
ncbi:MAG: hypothetical protein ACJ749_05230 [Flavisolibacter sp.]